MSRKKAKPLTIKQLADLDMKHELKKAAKIKARGIEHVTAAVTKPAKEPVVKTTMTEVMDAMNFSQQIGETVGRVAGVREGIAQGMTLPRNAGEQRVVDQKSFVSDILQEVYEESKKALLKHGPQHSPHEGYAVLAEELDELWAEVKADRGRMLSARAEAIQVAAMAVRYVLDNDPR